ncbi:DNA topoisomerase III [Ligilactobacillus salitolerans]|uniref:DNA topoisomerase n=1 Tax=Ligilactobacillus salitolerans TaxID=1808352 RepID=A0A401IUV9_9LACO|nr:DNA topoisomerase 3 [Ligilactobacillus salitolerans]GBG95295.1 DNA topoisomerase III [Ligilactobacillus salitolerans]
MKQLILAEKPSVARDLSQILGAREKHKNYFEGPQVVVTWALGHLLGLEMPEDLHKDWAQWQLTTLPMLPKKIGIKPLPKTRGQLKTIAALAKRKDVGEAVIATDAGREGELVARWILQYVRFNKPVKRLWISSQTQKAVKQGFNDLRPAKEYDNLYYSALARAKADWLVGLNVTRALTVKYDDNLSAGRVQTPTLAQVDQQAQKISQFKPRQYYVVSLEANGQTARRQQKDQFALPDQESAQKLVERLQQETGRVVKITHKDQSQGAPLPYDLTELQREANQAYGYSAKKTLSLVQSLYEIHKIVSYPRTDSKYLSSDLKATMAERLQAITAIVPEAKSYLKAGSKVVAQKVFNDQKVTDHHALIPTEQVPNYAKLSQDEHRIYTMIVQRFAGLFAQPYRTKQEKVTVAFGNEQFIFKHETVVESGWKTTSGSETATQEWQEGTKIAPKFRISAEQTTPPAPLNEGSLLAKMEKYGLGTPATRAEIIEKLVKTELMERTGKHLQVTPKGKQLLGLVNPALISPELTAKWEEQLEQISHGQYDSRKFLSEIEAETKKLVAEIKNSDKKYHDHSLTSKKCPKCGAALKERQTRDGKILVCTNPECDYHRRAEAKVTNHRCPQCHRKMLLVEGKNGTYFRCKYDGTTEKPTGGKKRSKKMTKHEEKRLLKKVNQDEEPAESALALALKKAMEK